MTFQGKNLIKPSSYPHEMALTKLDLAVLKILVGKELQHVKKDGEKMVIVNAPFISKIVEDDSDLNFLKSMEKYKEFLEELNRKL